MRRDVLFRFQTRVLLPTDLKENQLSNITFSLTNNQTQFSQPPSK
jgi:hypothetical protein